MMHAVHNIWSEFKAFRLKVSQKTEKEKRAKSKCVQYSVVEHKFSAKKP